MAAVARRALLAAICAVVVAPSLAASSAATSCAGLGRCAAIGDDGASALQVLRPPEAHRCRWMPKSSYVVAFIFAGRQDRMQVNLVYLDHLLTTCALDELHVWGIARNREDREWIKTLANKEGYSVFLQNELKTDHGGTAQFFLYRHIYQYYSTRGGTFEGDFHALNHDSMPSRFVPHWDGANQQNTVLVKLDDDIMYIDVRRFPSFVEYVRRTPEMFMVHASSVNNGVSAYYQAKQDFELMKVMPELEKYPQETFEDGGGGAMRPYLDAAEEGRLVQYGRAGPLWKSAHLAEKIHRYFFDNPSRFVHETGPHGERCIVFKGPEQHFGQGRISINFWGAQWAAFDTIDYLLSDDRLIRLGDEFLLTVAATTKPGIQECILPDMVVAHLSFGFMRNKNASFDEAVLEWYKALAAKGLPAFDESPHRSF